VRKNVEKNLSPGQISGWLGQDFPDDSPMQDSHGSTYQSLYLLSWGGPLRRPRPKALVSIRDHREQVFAQSYDVAEAGGASFAEGMKTAGHSLDQALADCQETLAGLC